MYGERVWRMGMANGYGEWVWRMGMANIIHVIPQRGRNRLPCRIQECVVAI